MNYCSASKQCAVCKNILPLSYFSQRQGRCKKCYSVAQKQIRAKLAEREHVIARQAKICSLCKVEKDRSEFYADKRVPDGLQYHCKECFLEGSKKYRENHCKEKKELDKKYRENHKNERRIWLLDNRERIIVYKKMYDEEYRKNNIEKIKLLQKEYRKNNRDICNLLSSNYRARKRNCHVIDLTRKQWEFIKEFHRHRCYYCGIKPMRLTKDHIIPLSRGGAHSMDNIVPACQPCNSRKGARQAPMPVQPFLKLVITEEARSGRWE